MSEDRAIRLRRRSASEQIAYLAGKRAELVESGRDTAYFDAIFYPVAREVVAVRMAEVLRRALRVHWSTCPDCSAGKPLWDCAEGRQLWDLQVPGDAIALAT
jgi:hypothetical protein